MCKSRGINMAATHEDILDALSTIIMDLGAIREQVTNSAERVEINSQIKALTKSWKTIDNMRAGQNNQAIDDAKKELEEITIDLRVQKKQLKKVTEVIHRAAQAVAIAERVIKLVA